MRLPKRLLLLVPLALAPVLPAPASSQQTYAGLLIVAREDGTGLPLARAQVEVGGVGTVAATDSLGVARAATIPPGQRLVWVRRIGFQPEAFTVEFRAGETVEAELDLVRAPVQLEGVTVRERMPDRVLREAGFYERRNRGFGQFLTREDIDQRKPDALSTLMRGVPFVSVVFCEHCRERGYVLVSNRSSITFRGECRMHLYLDGMYLGTENIDKVSVNQVEAVEVYRTTAGMPPQYNATNSACGVVLLWTRTAG